MAIRASINARSSKLRSIVALTCAVGLSLTACSGSGGGSKGSTPSLSVTPFTTDGGSNMVPWLAKSLNLFKKYNVNVDVRSVGGASIVPLLVSGRTDLIDYSFPAGLLVGLKGQSISIIAANEPQVSDNSLATLTKIASVDQLRATKGCKIATSVPGSAAYGLTTYLIKSLDLSNCSILPQENQSLITASVVSGRVEAGVESAATVSSAKQLHIIAGSGTPEAAQLPAYPYTGFTGLHDNLAKKKTAVVRFLKAIRDANDYIRTHTPEVIAKQLLSLSAFKGQTVDALVAGITLDKAGWLSVPSSAAGMKITSQQWSTSLSNFATWGIKGFNSSSAEIQYGKVVDGSYLSTATGTPR